MKTEHKLFFVIPFDSATKNLYERICGKIRKKYPTITTIIGNEEIGPSPLIPIDRKFDRSLRDNSLKIV